MAFDANPTPLSRYSRSVGQRLDGGLDAYSCVRTPPTPTCMASGRAALQLRRHAQACGTVGSPTTMAALIHRFIDQGPEGRLIVQIESLGDDVAQMGAVVRVAVCFRWFVPIVHSHPPFWAMHCPVEPYAIRMSMFSLCPFAEGLLLGKGSTRRAYVGYRVRGCPISPYTDGEIASQPSRHARQCGRLLIRTCMNDGYDTAWES